MPSPGGSSVGRTAPSHGPHLVNSSVALQIIVPSVHAPTPRSSGRPGQQAFTSPTLQPQPSSTWPLPSLSCPSSQISVAPKPPGSPEPPPPPPPPAPDEPLL